MKTIKNYFLMFGCAFCITIAFHLLFIWIVKTTNGKMDTVAFVFGDGTFLICACIIFIWVKIASEES